MQVHSPDYDSSVRCCRSEEEAFRDCDSTSDSAVKNDEESMQFESESENADAVLEEDKKSDSLSSSISMTDSDISSPEDCDSLDLSESESITDVTPLNSPYCDSPLPHARCGEQKYKDISPTSQSVDSRSDATFLAAKQATDPQQPNTEEMNLIISAIQKLEFEKRQNLRPEKYFSLNKRKSCACGNDDGRRPEQENHHLFKRIISQQNRKVYSLQPQYPHKTCSSSRYWQHRHADSDSTILLKKFQPSNKTKESSRTHSHRQQKCLSHPSSYAFAETEAIAKMSSSGSSPKSLCNSASDTSSPDAGTSSQGAMYDAKSLCNNEDMGNVDFSEEMSIH